MMTNKQQIDTMLDDMTNILVDECRQEIKRNRYGGHTSINMRVLAQTLFIQNYRKVPENAVVLTEEEYNALMREQKRLKEIVDRIPCGYAPKDEIRKKIAKELITKFLVMLARVVLNVEEDTIGANQMTNAAYFFLQDKLKELAKQCGTEVLND